LNFRARLDGKRRFFGLMLSAMLSRPVLGVVPGVFLGFLGANYGSPIMPD
jgi:hypothetical protein